LAHWRRPLDVSQRVNPDNQTSAHAARSCEAVRPGAGNCGPAGV
jgi:hypothetical protein